MTIDNEDGENDNEVFPRKGFGDSPPPSKINKQKQNNRSPLQMLAVKVQYLRALSIFEGGGGFSHGPVRAPRNKTNGTLLKG